MREAKGSPRPSYQCFTHVVLAVEYLLIDDILGDFFNTMQQILIRIVSHQE